MPVSLSHLKHAICLLVALASAMCSGVADAASCKTQSQLTSTERDALSNAARAMLGDIQSGNVQALRAKTIPPVAADFEGIAASADTLKPIVQRATVTIDSLFALDASAEPAGLARTDFYCGTPIVVLNFTDLPPGNYALVIVHATGVPKPQQISLVLSKSADGRWLLGGFFSRPMMMGGHDGLWYWTAARAYSQKNMNWDAWFYYRLAAYSLSPVDFLSSPNLEKLQHEQDRVKPGSIPSATQPLMIGAHGSIFQVTGIDLTTTFGPLDLEVRYDPSATQETQLNDPPTARRQVTELMIELLSIHPELRDAFHGIWVHADRGSASLVSLELSMDQIALDAQPRPVASNPTLQ